MLKHVLVSIDSNYFHQKNKNWKVYFSESYLIPHHLDVSSLRRVWNGPLSVELEMVPGPQVLLSHVRSFFVNLFLVALKGLVQASVV